VPPQQIEVELAAAPVVTGSTGTSSSGERECNSNDQKLILKKQEAIKPW